MLKKIDQSEIDNLDDSQRQNLMVNAEGEYVFAQADEKEWKKHLERVKASEAAQQQVQLGNKELQDRGLECSIDKRMFVDPMKTPCCGKTYCHECIENALLETDLTCPGCETENVSLERLEPDEEMRAKITAYEADKEAAKAKSRSPSTSPKSPKTDQSQLQDSVASQSGSKSPSSESVVSSKKRTAGEAADDKPANLAAPAMKRQKSGENSVDRKGTTPVNNSTAPLPPNMMPPDMATMMQNMPSMNFPFSTMPMSMPGIPFMPMAGMMNPGMMQNFMPPNFSMMNGLNGGMNGIYPPNFNNLMMNGSNYNQANLHPNQNQNFQQRSNSAIHEMQGVPTGPKSMTQNYPPTGPAGQKFSNQQRHTGKEEDNAYMRQPVNPHRHQNRGKRARQADYREL